MMGVGLGCGDAGFLPKCAANAVRSPLEPTGMGQLFVGEHQKICEAFWLLSICCKAKASRNCALPGGWHVCTFGTPRRFAQAEYLNFHLPAVA